MVGWFRKRKRQPSSAQDCRQVLATGHPEFAPLAAAGLADIQRRRGS
jgi:hypothetical protein